VLLFMNTSWKVSCFIILGGLAFFVVNLIMRQESMLYVPVVMPGMQTPANNPEGYRSPADKKLEYEDVRLETADGIRLHAWFITCGPESPTAPTILFCHANAGNIGLRVPNYEGIIKRLQANILALDYRGYGYSEGSPSEDGLIEDACCAWKWLKAAAGDGRIDGKRIFVFGRSLGGAVAIALAQTLQRQSDPVQPLGLILENTFSSIGNLVDTMFPFLAFQALKDRFLRIKWESLRRITEVKVPLLFLSGLKDELVPASHMEQLSKAANQSLHRKTTVFEEGMHNDTWQKGGELYWETQSEFMKKCWSLAQEQSDTSHT